MTRCDAYWDKVRKLLAEDNKEGLKKFCEKSDDMIRLIVDHVEYEEKYPTMVGYSERALRPLRSLEKKDDTLHTCALDLILNEGLKPKDAVAKVKPLPKPKALSKFTILLADPPWEYDFSKSKSRKIENQYDTETLARLKSIKIESEDAVLFLWATAPKLREALEVMQAWGFEYKTHAIWNKQIMGMGYWFRGQHELFLIGTKGNVAPPPESERISSIISEKRTEHSKKPEIFYSIIERLFPHAEYIELFARKTREGWKSLGDEI